MGICTPFQLADLSANYNSYFFLLSSSSSSVILLNFAFSILHMSQMTQISQMSNADVHGCVCTWVYVG